MTAKQRKTGKLQPDEGTIEWARHVTAGYLDQHAHLTAGMTIESVLDEPTNHLDVDYEGVLNHIPPAVR